MILLIPAYQRPKLIRLASKRWRRIGRLALILIISITVLQNELTAILLIRKLKHVAWAANPVVLWKTVLTVQ